jgi:hypothetical protein
MSGDEIRSDAAWAPLADRAFAAYLRGDETIAANLILRIVTEYGQECIIGAISNWLDTVIVRGFGVTEFQPSAGIKFAGIEPDGSVESLRYADGSQSREVVWAGRMLVARITGDRDLWEALIRSVLDDPDLTDAGWGEYVHVTLDCCALTFKRLQSQGSTR